MYRTMLQVRGDPVPRVQWYRDGMELNDPRFVAHFDGSQRCTLAIQELRDGDSGRYMCEATNRLGRVSTFARLFVVNDPKILEADHKLKRWVNIMMSVCFCYIYEWCKKCDPSRRNNAQFVFLPRLLCCQKENWLVGRFTGFTLCTFQ